MRSIRACLPQGQPGRAVESVLRQSAFLQTDTPRKHAPSEACCSRCTHTRGPCSVSLLPFRIGLDAFTASPTHFLSRWLSCRYIQKSLRWHLLQFLVSMHYQCILPPEGPLPRTERSMLGCSMATIQVDVAYRDIMSYESSTCRLC